MFRSATTSYTTSRWRARRRGARERGIVADNPVFACLDAFDSQPAEVLDLKERYERCSVGNQELKDRLTLVLNNLLAPMRERRAAFERNMAWVRDAVEAGSKRERVLAVETMALVHDALGLGYLGQPWTGRRHDISTRD